MDKSGIKKVPKAYLQKVLAEGGNKRSSSRGDNSGVNSSFTHFRK